VKKIGLLIGNSGFYSEKIFNHLEERETPISYIIAVLLYAPIQKKYPNSEFGISINKEVMRKTESKNSNMTLSLIILILTTFTVRKQR
jgi:hypothetical protein